MQVAPICLSVWKSYRMLGQFFSTTTEGVSHFDISCIVVTSQANFTHYHITFCCAGLHQGLFAQPAPSDLAWYGRSWLLLALRACSCAVMITSSVLPLAVNLDYSSKGSCSPTLPVQENRKKSCGMQ